MTMKHLTKMLMTLTILLCATGHAQAKVISDLVAAVVNKNVITKQDLDDRYELTLRHIGQQKLTKEQKKQIYNRTLADLINEEIKIQYAKQNKIGIKSGELNLAITSIEKSNHLPAGSFYKISHGLEDTAKRQVEAEMYWQKIIDSRVRPRINVTNAELDKLISNLIGKEITEKEVYQVVFTIEDGLDEKTTASSVDEFYKSIHNKGLSFEEISARAKEFGASHSGYLGWFGPGELSKALDQELEKMTEGQISKPIRSAGSWHILQVGSIRNSQNLSMEPVRKYKVLRLSKALSSNEKTRKKEISKFEDETEDLERFSQMEGLMMKHEGDASYSQSKDFGWIARDEMPSDVLQAITPLEKGSFSEPIIEDGRIDLYYLANIKEEMPEKLQEYRNRMRERIMMNRIELSARRFMRDLRRQAYIDIRI